MQNLQDLPADSSPKIPRKRRTRADPTEDELLEEFRTARRALADLRKRTRNQAVLRLGALAFKAGLAVLSDDVLTTEFAAIAKRTLGMLVLMCSLVLFPSCVAATPLPELPEPAVFILSVPGAFGKRSDRSWIKCESIHTVNDHCEYGL